MSHRGSVSLVVSDTGRGGTPNRLADLARALGRRGWRIQIMSLMPKGAVAEDLAAEGFAVGDVGLTSSKQLVSATLDLRSALRLFCPDLIHTALFHANILGRVVGRSLNCPVVCGYESVYPVSRAWALAYRLTAPLATGHVAVSEAVGRAVAARLHIPLSDIDIIPLGKSALPIGNRVAVRSELGIPSDAVVVGFVGRLHPHKDLVTLASAVDLLPFEAWLLLVGDGPDRSKLQHRPRTIITGMQANPSRFLGALDVFAMSSLLEGMPGALAEAMSAGLPVVATEVGGIPDLVTDGVDGILAAPANPGALALAIETALARPDLGPEAARTISTRFSVHAMADRYEAVFRRVISEGRV